VRPVIQWGSALAEDLTHKPEDLLTVARPCRTLTGFQRASCLRQYNVASRQSSLNG